MISFSSLVRALGSNFPEEEVETEVIDRFYIEEGNVAARDFDLTSYVETVFDMEGGEWKKVQWNRGAVFYDSLTCDSRSDALR